MSSRVVIKVNTRKSTVRASDGARVIVVPSLGRPGPPGPPGEDAGDLTPEERQALVDDVEAEVLEALEPDVNLVVRFRNIRSQG